MQQRRTCFRRSWGLSQTILGSIFKNKNGEVIYVGKAKSLRRRVFSYFQSGDKDSPKTRLLVANIADLEYMLVDTEMEAFMLELNLIHKYKPRYNIRLKDDKHYPFIKVTLDEEYPRVFLVRRVKKMEAGISVLTLMQEL